MTCRPVTYLLSSVLALLLFCEHSFADEVTYAVGAIPYETGTTPSGGFTLSVPIMTIPCPGMVPQISLVYNSQGQEGVAGVGWDIDGLSAITLDSKNWYYDGAVSSPDPSSQTWQQVYSLDGARLVIGDEEMDGYPFVTVSGEIWVERNMLGNAVSSFHAICPDHSSRQYGFSTNDTTRFSYPISIIRDEKGYAVSFEYIFEGNRYYVSRIRYGGKDVATLPYELSFVYSPRTRNISGFVSGKEISLTRKLAAVYSRNNNQTLGIYSLSYRDYNGSALLEKIGFESATGEQLPPLTFTYGAKDNPSHQQLIKNTQLALPSFSPQGANGISRIRGHFLRNSYSDGLISFGLYPTYEMFADDDYTSISYHSPYPAYWSIMVTPSLDTEGTASYIAAGNEFQTVGVADVDGDGKDEVVKVNFGTFDEDDSNLLISVYSFSNPYTGYTTRSYNVQVYGKIEFQYDPDDPEYPVIYSPMERSYYFGDFLGNGKTQLLTICHSADVEYYFNMVTHLALVDLQSGTLICDTPLGINFDDTTRDNYAVLDVDGDGRSDFYDLVSGNVYSLGANNEFSCSRNQAFPQSALSNLRSFWGDINADGLPDYISPPTPASGTTESHTYPVWAPNACPFCNATDPITSISTVFCRSCNSDLFSYYWAHPEEANCHSCHRALFNANDDEDPLIEPDYQCPDHGRTVTETSIVYPSAAYEWKIYINTGRSFIEKTQNSFLTSSGDAFTLLDLNRDGYMDIIKINGDHVMAYINDGGVFRTTPMGIPLTFSHSSLHSLSVTHLNAFKASHPVIIENNQVSTLSLGSPDNTLLTSFYDSYGNKTLCSYSTAFDSGGPYSPTTTSRSYPLCQTQLSVPLLSGVKKFIDGDSTTVSYESYRYVGSVLDLQRKSFVSFEQATTTDSLRSHTARTVFNPLLRGTPSSMVSPTTESWFNYSIQVRSDKREKILLTWQRTHDIATDRLTEFQRVYDNYGFLTEERGYDTWIYDFEDGDFDPDKMYINRYTYDHDTDHDYYRLGLLTESESHEWIYLQDEDEDCLRKVTYEYDYKNQLIRQSAYAGYYDGNVSPSYSLEKTTTWTYDYYNNVLSERSAPFNSTQYVGKTYTYDSNGRMLTSVTDEFGQTTTYSGYDRFNHPSSASDNRGRTTTYTYDSFGNLVIASYPDASSDSTLLAWGGQGKYTITRKSTGKPDKITHFDALGRTIRSSEKTFNGLWRSIDVQYDSLGRKWKTSLPFCGNQPTLWNTSTYDTFDRIIRLDEASGRVSTWTYGTHSITSVIDSISTIRRFSPSGFISSVTDSGGTASYETRADGQIIYTYVTGGGTTSFGYDIFGRRISLNDPCDGLRTTTYDDYSDGTSRIVETNTKGSVTTYYDKYGRITRRERSGAGGFNTVYSYDAYNRLVSEISSNGTGKVLQYDSLDRIVSIRDTVPDGKWLLRSYTYGPGGRIATVAYTSQNGYINTETYAYANGHNTGITLDNSLTALALVSENELGLITEIITGNISREYGYTSTGFPTSRNMNYNNVPLQRFSYQFNAATGNLTSRTNLVHSQTENFGYDDLNRITAIGYRTISYTNNGNINAISGVGTMAYTNTSRPYEQTAFTPDPGVDPGDYIVTYTSFDRPNIISTSDVTTASFTYNTDGDRVKMKVLYDSDLVITRYYIGGCYELDITDDGTVERLYIGGDAYSAPVVLQKESGPWTFYNIGRDYLGSITHITTNNGTIVAEYSYDPWGRLRNPETLEIYPAGYEPTLFLGRGFTGHEHLPWFGLINMNARLYDPLLGRFLQPDPYIQNPEGTQNFNRYSYALNNPLRYTDESGESIVLAAVAGVIIGGYFGGVLSNGSYNPFHWDFSSKKTWKYMAGGALTGLITSTLGASITAAMTTAGISIGASTFSSMLTSTTHSILTKMYSSENIDMSINFGVFSWNLSQGNIESFKFQKESILGDIGYFIGTIGLVSDILRGNNPGSVELSTVGKPPIGHMIVKLKGKVVIDIGPENGSKDAFYFKQAINNYSSVYNLKPSIIPEILIDGVNTNTLTWISNNISSSQSSLNFYNVFFRNCATAASAALILSGVPIFAHHPYLVAAEAYLWSQNIRLWNYSYYLTD